MQLEKGFRPVDPVVEECLLDRASTPLTKGYLKSFIKRTEDSDEALRSTTPRYVDNLRAEVQREDLTQFFELVVSQTDLRKYHPKLIANLDETFFEVKADKSKVLVPSRLKQAFTIDEQALFHLTIVVTIFADGTTMDPSLIFPLKQFPAELETEPTLIDSFSYAGQSSGWIDKPIFADIVKKTLIPEFEQRRRSLGPGFENQWGILYVDGHTSREQPEVLEILREHKIDVISFVAHASHLLQPLDLWVFLMLKKALESSRAQFSASRPEQRMQMLRELEKALALACMKSNILKSFQLSGIYPVKPSAVLADQFGSAPKQEEAASSDKPKRNYININGKLLTASEIVEALRARDKIKADKEAKKRSREEKKSSREEKKISDADKNKDAQSAKKPPRPQILCRITPLTRRKTTKRPRTNQNQSPSVPAELPTVPATVPHAPDTDPGQCTSCGVVITLTDGICSNSRCTKPQRKRSKPMRFQD